WRKAGDRSAQSRKTARRGHRDDKTRQIRIANGKALGHILRTEVNRSDGIADGHSGEVHMVSRRMEARAESSVRIDRRSNITLTARKPEKRMRKRTVLNNDTAGHGSRRRRRQFDSGEIGVTDFDRHG